MHEWARPGRVRRAILLGAGLATRVASTSGDDGYRPFADGAYTVVEDAGQLRVWYVDAWDPLARPATPSGAPRFVLPVVTDRVAACGIETATRTPLAPSPRPPDPGPDRTFTRLRPPQ